MGQVLLARHGQASWGAADYDVLSETGWEQSRLLGQALAARRVEVDLVLSGSMRRQQDTAQACLAELPSAPEVVIDQGWDEFDHVAMLASQPSAFGDRRPTRAEFQEWFESATDRWTDGQHDADYAESFAAFTDRVGSAVRRTAQEVGSGTALVLTSGGPIAWATASLICGDRDSAGRVWRRLNPVCVNSGVTRLVTGRRGTTLISFNDHAHLDGVPGALTYR